MSKVNYLPRATADIASIWDHIADDSKSDSVADRFVRRFHDVAGEFADQPLMGAPRPDLSTKARAFVVGQYVAFYQPTSSGIDIVRVIHGARDIPRLFDSP